MVSWTGFSGSEKYGDGTTWSSERGKEPKPGEVPTGNSGNGGNGSSSGNLSPAQKQIADIYNDQAVRNKLISIIAKARLINPDTQVAIGEINAKGSMAVSFTGLDATQGRDIGLVGNVISITVKGGVVSVSGYIETGHALNPTAGNKTATSAEIAGSQIGVTVSVMQGNIPTGYLMQGGKIGIKQDKYTRISTGHGEHEDVYAGKVFVEIPELTAAYNTGLQQKRDGEAKAAKDKAEAAKAEAARQAAIAAAAAAAKAAQEKAKAEADAAAKAAKDAAAKAAAEAAAKAAAAKEAEAKAKAEAAAKAAAAAAKAAEEARIAAEKAKAMQARQIAAGKLYSPDIQAVRGVSVGVRAEEASLAWSVAGAGTIALGDDIAATIMARVSAVVAEFRNIAFFSMAGPVVATIAGLMYPSKAGDPSDSIVPGRDISNMIPTETIGLGVAPALEYLADNNIPLRTPLRGRLVLTDEGMLETQLVLTPFLSTIPVVRAFLNKETGYWGYTLPAIAGAPTQTILISPSDAPGADSPLTLTGPVPLPEKIMHTGDQEVIHQEATTTITPVPEDLEFNDVVIVFPLTTNLHPLYIMYRSPRNMPGTASGNGQDVGDNWLGSAGKDNGVPIPSSVASKLQGKNFSSFNSFRRALWKAVAEDPDLSKQFTEMNLKLMKKGLAPVVSFKETVGKRLKVELHHNNQISEGGEVYNVDNLSALTPKRHIEIHKEKSNGQ